MSYPTEAAGQRDLLNRSMLGMIVGLAVFTALMALLSVPSGFTAVSILYTLFSLGMAVAVHAATIHPDSNERRRRLMGLGGVVFLIILLAIFNKDLLTGNVSLEKYRTTSCLTPPAPSFTKGAAAEEKGSAKGGYEPLQPTYFCS